MSRWNDALLRNATAPRIGLCLALAAASLAMMAGVLTPAFEQAAGGMRPFDLNFGLTAEVMYQQLPAYTDRARLLYLAFAAVDYVYPVAAAGFFALLWAWMFKRAGSSFADRVAGSGILAVPFLHTAIDWAENAGFLFVIFSYPTRYPAIAAMAGTLKTIKPMVAAFILVLTVLFAASVLWTRQSRR
ncbi:MAG: hypothetical protein FJ197_07485 [Gammaproteobacteria bacterium]|nr:hypothetical protein [Gammaproteobacteria bacterium]